MNFVAATFTVHGGWSSSRPALWAGCYWRLWVTVILAEVVMFEMKVILIFGATGIVEPEYVAW